MNFNAFISLVVLAICVVVPTKILIESEKEKKEYYKAKFQSCHKDLVRESIQHKRELRGYDERLKRAYRVIKQKEANNG